MKRKRKMVAVGLTLHRFWPVPTGLPCALRQGLAAVLFGAALPIMLGAVGVFRRARTDIRPWKATSAIVTDGPYRFARNPMYLGMALVFGAVGLVADSLIVLSLLVPLVAVINWGVIRPRGSSLPLVPKMIT